MNKKNLAIIIAVIESLLFVILSSTVRLMSSSFSIPQQMFVRLFGAFVLSVIIFYPHLVKIKFKTISSKEWSIYFLRSLIYYGISVTLFTYAILHATLSVVSFASSLPIMGLLAYLYFKEKFDLKIIPIIILSVIGLGFLSKINIFHIKISLGLLAALGSLVLFDSAFLMVRLHNKKFNNYQNTTIVLAFSWLVPLITLLVQHKNIWPNHVTNKAYVGLIISILLNVFNLYFLNYIFTNLKAFVAGNILLLEGVFALGIGYLFFHESIDLLQYFGVVIILGSSISVAYLENKESN